MKAVRVAIVAGILAAGIALLGGCGSTDVVAKYANVSFDALVKALPAAPVYSQDDGAWVLTSPKGDEFSISSDFARNGAMGSGMADMDKPDAEFSFDAKPFLAAGLDLAKLPKTEGIKYELEDGRFMLHFELGSDAFPPEAATSLEASFAQVVKTQRARIGYHEKLDHYGIKLGGGNMLEWAKDLGKNDKDLVFVLAPEAFIAAGMDPAKIEGWAFAKVETKDDSGKTVFVDKLLKAYNLK